MKIHRLNYLLFKKYKNLGYKIVNYTKIYAPGKASGSGVMMN